VRGSRDSNDSQAPEVFLLTVTPRTQDIFTDVCYMVLQYSFASLSYETISIIQQLTMFKCLRLKPGRPASSTVLIACN